MSRIAIIGDNGLEIRDHLKDVKELSVSTPFGLPHPVIYSGLFEGIEIIHLCRHGKENAVSPARINHKANMYALKLQNCSHILASTTCRSLQEEICPGEIIIPDQFIDQTTQLNSGIYDDLKPGVSVYLPMGEPFSAELCDHMVEAAIVQGITVHTKGIVLSIDGPRFSSRAESNLYRTWGADVINLVTSPEVILANELGIPYAALALCTGYDSWRTGEPDQEAGNGKAIVSDNRDKIMRILTYVLKKIE
jgi:5'-methylthioadenosine phosphorylase